jgi:virulence factor Mce-like protein
MRDRFKRPIEEYNKIWLGAVALAVVAAVVAGVVLIGRLSLGETGYRAEFTQAAQIRPGDQVTIAGVAVGEVRDLTLATDHVVVAFTLRKDIHLGAATRASIKLTTLLGSRYVAVEPAGGGSLEQRTIRIANTSVPYDLQEALADATTTFEQVDGDRVADSIATLSSSLNGVPEALPQALNNVRSLAAIIAARRDQIGSLLRSVDTVTTTIRNQKANLGALVVQGRDLLAEIVSRRAAVEQLFADTTRLVNTIEAILHDHPAINEMLASIRDFSRMLAQHDALLRNAFQALPLPIRNLANATGSATALDLNVPAGPLVDSWMCALSGRAQQFGLTSYFTDCQPAPDPWPGWPPPQPERLPR